MSIKAVRQTLARWRGRGRGLAARLLRSARLDEPETQRKIRLRAIHYLRVAGGFIAAAIVFVIAALFLAEVASRPRLDPAPVLEASTPLGSQAIAAAAYLLSLDAEDISELDAPRLFAPPQLRAREAVIFAASRNVAETYLAHLPFRRGARDPLVAAVRADSGEARGPALQRLNAAIVRRQIVLDRSPQAFRALSRRAANACAARAARIAALAFSESPRADDANAAFFAARGEAYAWLLLLRGAAADSEDPGFANAPAFARAQTALARAAARRPVLFFRSAQGGAYGRNELAEIGLDLAVAAQAARALAER
ncbi:MAG: hypothetical protein AB7L65_00310 [Hyphomonadaceae bacterium]